MGRRASSDRTITAELSPAMRTALLLGHACRSTVARALARRRMSCPGGRRTPLDTTPLGRQIGRILADYRRLRETIEEIDRLLGSTKIRTLAEHHPDLARARDVVLRALVCSRRWV